MILWFINDQPILDLMCFSFKGRAGADGGRGEIGEVGAKVQGKKKKRENYCHAVHSTAVLTVFLARASSFAPLFLLRVTGASTACQVSLETKDIK